MGERDRVRRNTGNLGNGNHDRLGVVQNILVRKPQYLESFGFQITLATRVFVLDVFMVCAVYFYDQFLFHTDEIDDVNTNRILSSKFQAS